MPKPKKTTQQIISFLGKSFIPTVSKSEPSTSKEEIRGIFPNSDINFGFYGKGGDFFIGDKVVEQTEDGDGNWYISIGESPNKKTYLLTDGLYELITKKNPDSEKVKITSNDISMYNKILIDSNTLYVNNKPSTKKLKSEDDPEVTKTGKWDIIIKPAWEDMQKGKGKGKSKKTGKGLKKVVIPSDPNALLEKLDLLIASKAAGNTGLRNELVSVCDELKRQGVFGNETYKRIMSLL